MNLKARFSNLSAKGAVLAGSAALALTPFVAFAVAGPSSTVSVTTISDPISGTHTPPFVFDCDTNPLYNPVMVSGTATAVAPPGNLDQYHVSVDWGDGVISDQVEASAFGTAHGTATRAFSSTHSYTTNGSHSIVATIYHTNGSGNDNTADATFTIPTCVYVPPPNTGALLVTKAVDNTGGGTKVPSDFTLNVTNSSSTPSSFHPTTSTTTVTLTPGSYSIGETADASYTPSYSSDCSGSIAIGETRVCHVTNTFAPTPPPTTGTLHIVKHVVNDNSGSAAANAFTMDITATNPSSNHFAGSEAGVDVTVDPGSYSVDESGGPAGYTKTLGAGCSGTIAAGETKSCTITNDDNAPTTGTLHIVKHVVNDNGDSAVAGDFSLHVMSGANDVANSPQAGSEAGTDYTLAGGSYSVSETGGPAGYGAIFSGDCNSDGVVTVTNGQEATCTITNDDIAPSLTLIKQVSGSDTSPASWTLTATGDQESSVVLTGTTPVSSGPSFQAGTFALSESSGPGGYTASAWSCVKNQDEPVDGSSITLGLGDSATCTITNTFIPPTTGTLTVVKAVTNDNGGAAAASDFTIHVMSDGADVDGSPAVGSTTGQVYTLPGGSYTVSEDATSTYASSLSECGDGGSITVTNGQNVTCTITNDDIAPQLTVIKHVVNDNNGSAQAGDFTMSVDGTNVSSSTFAGAEEPGTTVTLDAGTYSVSETGPDGYGASMSSDCSGAIGLGESKTCTVTNDDGAASLTIVKNATGLDRSFDFSVVGTGDTVASSSATVGVVGGEGSTTVALDAGSYDVTENVPTGWVLGGVSCIYDNESIGSSVQNGEHIIVDAGDVVTCTFTDRANQADLSLTKSVDNATPDNGATITYTVTVANAGPADASGVSVTDPLPSGVSYVSDDSADTGTTYATSTGEWVIGGLAAGTSTTLHITATVTAAAGEQVTNTASVQGNDEGLTDPDEGNNNGDASFTVNTPGSTPPPPEEHHGGGGGGPGCAPGTTWSPAANGCVPTGQVLGAATSTLGVTCGLYMDQHLRMGSPKNKPDQVTSLQMFLLKHGYGSFNATGYFGPLTFAAVKAFQSAYADAILKPWNLTQPTGLAYLTTIRQLNLLECPDLMIPQPELVPWNQNPNAQ